MQATLSRTVERPSQLLIDTAFLLGAKRPDRWDRDAVLEFIMHVFWHIGMMEDVAISFGPRFSSDWDRCQMQVEQFVEELRTDGIERLFKQICA